MPSLPSCPQAASPATPHPRRRYLADLWPLRRLAPLPSPPSRSPLTCLPLSSGHGPLWSRRPSISPDPGASTTNPLKMDPSQSDPPGSDQAPPSSPPERLPARLAVSSLGAEAVGLRGGHHEQVRLLWPLREMSASVRGAPP
ncbi:hypothetical protein ZWY2020_030849 [Hordeum vulgare]|nr:hypothetical protein ZWY2020_030849 [Hordeum vulgare]